MAQTAFRFLPTTADVVEYLGLRWKVTSIDPTYSSDGLIASRITARSRLMAKKFRGPEIIEKSTRL